VTLVTDSRIHTPIIMTLHVTREGVKNIQCNYRVSLLFFLSISPFPQPSPFLYSSPYFYITCKGPRSLSSSVGFIADWFFATSGIRASDLQTSTMPPETRSQDLKKLEDSFEVPTRSNQHDMHKF
jgi:hypothetical protein